MIKVADFVIDFFAKKSIDTAFTISGGGCIHLIEALRKSSMNVVCPHHEQTALMASEGYYRMSNRLALNVVTTGPGGTNTITGLLGLWLDSIPSIVISGQVPSNQLAEGTGCRQIGDQEFDIISVVKPMTKYAAMIRDTKDVLDILEEAYYQATHGRPGPVWIDIPLDIQGAQINEEDLLGKTKHKTTPLPSQDQIDAFIQLVGQAKKPLVIVGNGIRLSNTYSRLNSFLAKSNIPVVTGPHSGVDAVDNTLPNYCGRIGILGQLTSNTIVQEADLLICLGTRLPVKMTGYNIAEFSPNSKKVFVDIDVNEINKHTFKVDQAIVTDLLDFFNAIEDVSFNLDIREWLQQVSAIRATQRYYHPKHENIKGYASFYYLISKAPSIFKNTPIVTSNGSAHVITLQTYQLNKDQRLFTNVGCASMGYGLPAAIGACIANNKQDVICVEGDGSIMMNLQELETVAGYKLPVKIILINNDGYLSIKLSQEAFFNGEEFASSPATGVTIPNFKKVADAFNIRYSSISSNQEIESRLQEMMNIEGPCILEVFTHPKERHEPKVTHKGIGPDGKIIPGTLTDMFISDSF
jgi:acetolactate synthase-1/2/3 large subunit